MNKILRFCLFFSVLIFSWLLYSNASLFQIKHVGAEELKKVIKPGLKKANLEERMKWLDQEVTGRAAGLLENLKKNGSKATLIVYKKEREMELWTQSESPKKLKTWSLYAYSGKLGPKNREGDAQIPEGVYRGTHLNPNSSYYLSMGINYPNDNDRKRAQKNEIEKPGGDIFIHGRRNSVGCVSIGDHNMEEVFYLAGKISPQNIKVLIAPSKLPLPDLKSLGLSEKDPLIKEKYSQLAAEMAPYN